MKNGFSTIGIPTAAARSCSILLGYEVRTLHPEMLVLRDGQERSRQATASSPHTYRCGCGHEMDRDLNAALNLRRIGLVALGLEDVGQAMPERVREIRLPANACGEDSGGRVSQATFSRVSRNQESELSSTNFPGSPMADNGWLSS